MSKNKLSNSLNKMFENRIISHSNKKVGGVVLTSLVSIILLVVVILPISYAFFRGTKEVDGSVSVVDYDCVKSGFTKLSECILVTEVKSNTVELAKEQITAKGPPNFSQIAPPASGEDTVSGMYSTSDDYGKSYYYRGDIKNNYVSYAGYIWRIMRVNGDGTIRMIYSGTKTSDIGDATSIGKTQYNWKNYDPTYVGYKYGENFSLNTTSNVSTEYTEIKGSIIYYFGTNYTFDSSTKKFKLTGNMISGTWENIHTQAIANYPYTCFSTSATGTCDVMIKTTGYSNATVATVHLISNSSKDYNSTLLNITDSPIKTALENWYEINILNKKDSSGNLYSDYISDEVFCNDRSVVDGSGYLLSPLTTYGPYVRLFRYKQPSLKCLQSTDKFSVSAAKGNAGLKYPVGLITMDEAGMAGGVAEQPNKKYYLYNGRYYWTISAAYFSPRSITASVGFIGVAGEINTHGVQYSIDIRPVINLSSNVLISGGNGTALKPYILKLA